MKKYKFNRKEMRIKLPIISIMFLMLILSFFFAENLEKLFGLNQTYAQNEVSASELSNDFKVHYIDVGQGNSTLVELPDGKTILIDGGNTSYGSKVYEYLAELGITKIDFLIATHADSDHIGGLNYLFDKLEIVNIYRPFQIAGSSSATANFVPSEDSGTGSSTAKFVPYEDEDLKEVYYSYLEELGNKTKISRVTTEVYKKFITNIYSETYEENGKIKNSTVTVFYDGLEISGERYSLKFYYPEIREGAVALETITNTYGYATVGYGVNDSNGASAIFLLEIDDFKFLFTGDAPWTDGSDTSDEEVTLLSLTMDDVPEVVILVDYSQIQFVDISLYSDSTGFEELDFIQSLTESEIFEVSDVDVYLLGHHGSKYSSSEELLTLASPRFAVVSVGENSYGHPSTEALSRLAKTTRLETDYLLRTDEMGTIIFGTSNSKLCYCLENTTATLKITLTWQELGTILFLMLCVIVVAIEPKISEKTKIYGRLKFFGDK